MALEKIIAEIESGRDFLDFIDEVNPNILGNIQNELSQTGTRREIFDMASGLSNPIIEKYLLMDESSKVKMEQLYEQEREFFDIAGRAEQRKITFNMKYGEDTVFNLRQITNYNGIKKFLEEYCYELESMDLIPGLRGFQLSTDYLVSKGLGNWVKRDFEKGERFSNGKGNPQTNENITRSLTYGVPEELKERVLGHQKLRFHRIKFLENYCTEVESIENPAYYDVKLGVSYLRSKGLGNWAKTDFEKGELFNSKKGNPKTYENILRSLTHDIPEDLKTRVLELQSLLPHRIKFLENYCAQVENVDKLNKPYLRTKGLSSWISRDFETGLKLENPNYKNILRSITYGVPQELKERVYELNGVKL